MLKKLSAVRGTDAFDEFEWSGSALKRFNLVYGWNGSGKTTTSRVLALLEGRTMQIGDLAGAQFTVELSPSGIVNERSLHSHTVDIRVFNKDFVDDNLAFNDGKAKRIVILGETSIHLK